VTEFRGWKDYVDTSVA